jgi:ribosome-binding protein aMBF1 (putative translation factor)
LAGVAQETISRFERGDKFPKTSTIEKLESALASKLTWKRFLKKQTHSG